MNRTKLSNFVRSEVRSEENQDQIDVDSYENRFVFSFFSTSNFLLSKIFLDSFRSAQSDQHLSSNLASANSESDFIRRQKEKSHSPLSMFKK